VDDLKAVCDRLEIQLSANRAQKLKLLDALLHRALNGADLPELLTAVSNK
jgi:hypothetical protein